MNVCFFFLAQRFIRGSLTLFEIPYAFNSKNGPEQDSKEIFLFCILFRSCFAILQLCVCFQYPIFIDHAILKKSLHTMLSVAGKNSDTYTKGAHE